MNLKSIFKNVGPGPIIAAAFIGPGTVTVCTLAGVNFGFSLLWALGLSVISTILLQEISGRLGLITGKDLSQLIRSQTGNPILRYFSMGLVLIAIGLGNAAYESGNISGTNLGLQVFWEVPTISFSGMEIHLGNLILGIIAFGLLWIGNYKTLERALVGLVIFMSIAFTATAFVTKPDWSRVFAGFIPSWTDANLPTLVALIGTTVVPYNLFLYASLAKNRWSGSADIPWMRRDIVVSIVLGGIVSMAILIVGASNVSTEISSALDVSKGLEGVFGSYAKYFMGFGLMAAGLTSSITAPLAAGLVICGIMGWDQEIRSKTMRASMGVIVGMGLIFSSLGIKPIQLITLAQLANGVLLPLVSGWIIWIASQKSIMGDYRNKSLHTFIAVLIWLVTLLLGMKSIVAVLGIGN
ncbi:NRAMP (natural resistance-associated macrophage protein)-like metal ion transporter [Algoriphagus ratkowskyi]|uniref:Divalent metal cation transporter n=1 Tax=Algoriphagus ratkowskyi TaxID=57028 RepID=A0A2W7RD82_9BACT|nr:Nramp family divalent metal transporter [Algoriphagus ratkowskyi]PZX57086.1 NRAMP (natural resistance-associated macrophage protein)-like metal ion transporter [Algoriphagus ratkowskyi]TXD79980.1 divalent metal cation transporter [Algoriphagus ratkowskyi]